MTSEIAKNINLIAEFCGKRDINSLDKTELRSKYGIDQVDVMVLFGGSIICGGDILAEGIKNKIAKKYIIVGGAGHTTEALRIKMRNAYPEVATEGLPEAKIFQNYLKMKYNLNADYLECKSTNCGNNISYLLDLLKNNNITCNYIIISQDATMQFRMGACLRKFANFTIINYATYTVKVINDNGNLKFNESILGMWDMERYITLLMGEIPRLTDDENGYGPKGKNFISHVDIPEEITRAFNELKVVYSDKIREANPLFATSK